MATPIPPGYRLFFSTIDPAIAFTGAISALFFPQFILDSYSTAAVSPPSIETTMTLDSLAGFYLAVMFLQIFLLRAKPDDLQVWRLLQGSILITDVAIVAASGKAQNAQGRLNPMDWRLEEAGTIAITAGVGLFRIAFLMGLGLKQSRTASKIFLPVVIAMGGVVVGFTTFLLPIRAS
ncbi:hypothetical protein LTR53_012659 [Teratosphaeriaceae sp. CCFEE 6253]|nr:hypothetical protein LTR53_012659 [Teratosphaeriaceae sp. CCFEE 6253]